MKTKIILAASALALGGIVYFFRMNNAATTAFTATSPAASVNTPEATAPESSIAAAFNEAVAQYSSPEKIFSAYKEKPQQFEAKADGEINITGKQGTLIQIPANALVFEDGTKPTSVVSISLTECYAISDMILNTLSTTSNKQLLETAGMVLIEATAEGKKLKIAEGSAYTVSFPQESDKDDFKLFYGRREDNGGINWILADNRDNTEPGRAQSASLPGVASSQNSLQTGNCFIQISDSYFRRNLKISKMDYYTWQLAEGGTLNNWFLANFNPSVPMIDDFCVFNYQSQVTLKLDKNGFVKSRYLSKRTTAEYDLAILRIIDRMPALDMSNFMPRYDEDHAVVLQFGRKIGKSQDEALAVFEKKYGGEKGNLPSVQKEDMDYYIFSASELGWLNCDRFYDDPAPRGDFYVDCPIPEHTNVSLSFASFPGLLAGYAENGRIVFHDIPKNQKVKVIAVECSASAPRMVTTEAHTSKPDLQLTAFQPFALSDLKKHLK